MGTLTLGTATTPGTLAGEVYAALGNRSDVSARLTAALNLSQERLARLHSFAEMNKTVPSTLTYTGVAATDMYLPMPDTAPYIREIFSVVLKDGQQSHKLTQVPTRKWDRILGDVSASNVNNPPRFYTVWDYASAQAEIFPLPDKTYYVQWRISQWPTPLSATGDKSIFRFKDELIIEGAIIYLMYSLGKEEDAAKHVKKLALFLAEAIKTDPREPDIEYVPSVGIDPSNPQNDYWLDPFVRDINAVFNS